MEIVGREGAVVFADEPMCAPWVAAIGIFGQELATEGRACPITDEEKIDFLCGGLLREIQLPAIEVMSGGGDFVVPVDGDLSFVESFEQNVE